MAQLYFIHGFPFKLISAGRHLPKDKQNELCRSNELMQPLPKPSRHGTDCQYQNAYVLFSRFLKVLALVIYLDLGIHASHSALDYLWGEQSR